MEAARNSYMGHVETVQCIKKALMFDYIIFQKRPRKTVRTHKTYSCLIGDHYTYRPTIVKIRVLPIAYYILYTVQCIYCTLLHGRRDSKYLQFTYTVVSRSIVVGFVIDDIKTRTCTDIGFPIHASGKYIILFLYIKWNANSGYSIEKHRRGVRENIVSQVLTFYRRHGALIRSTPVRHEYNITYK